MMNYDEKLVSILQRRNFNNFWEALDYLILASYEEHEAAAIAMKMFNGDVWGSVVNAAKNMENMLGPENMVFVSGSTYSLDYRHTKTTEDDMFVELYLMTNEADMALKTLYKAYCETRKYEKIPELEKDIKILKLRLTTYLLISIFNEGYIKL